MRRFFVARLFAALALATPFIASSQDAELLPVEQAFALKATAIDRTRVAFEWTIADGYYLYRDRTKFVAGDGTTIGTASFGEGETKQDEFFGEVVVFHHAARAELPVTVGTDASQATVSVSVQGCHENDPKICYPPHRQTLTIALPAAVAASSPLASSPIAGAASPIDAPLAGGPLGSPAAPGVLPGEASPLLGGAGAASGAGLTDALPLPEAEAFRFEAITTPEDGILARFTMPPGYYLYRDKTTFSAQATPAVVLGAPRWPAGVAHEDEHFGAVTVYFGTAEVPLPLASADAPTQPRTLALTAQFQGCQENGICYPPMTRTVSLDLPAPSTLTLAGAAPATGASMSAATSERSESDRFSDLLARGSKVWALLVFFGVGIGLAFTPCVLPMVPILSGIIAGAGEHVSTKRAAFLSTVYVLASAIVFTIAGVVAGLAGENLQAILQKPWVLVTFAMLFVVLAFSMFGFYELQMPSWLQNRVNAWSNRQKPGSVAGVAVMGLLSALLVGPCVAPPLAGAVVYIGQQRDAWFGGAALFAMALGMGVPLIIFGASAGTLLPRAGAWMDAVKYVFGVVFLLLALWMLERVVAPQWILLGLGAILIGSAVHLGALERLPDDAGGWRRTFKAIGVLLLALGVLELVGLATGGTDYLRPLANLRGGSVAATAPPKHEFDRITTGAELDRALAAATAQRKAVLFDFYADWCVECKRMEKYTFTDPAVVAALGDFVTLKVDVTAQNDADRALQQRFSIIGPPGTLFFACENGERRHLRLVGFEDAGDFATRLDRARGC